ncbi:MAG: methyltransferase domain-containing protein [Puniceicoccaceae bacterium]|nr:MAG: methyltransferase domain-containing protein [Puniceicoccaceae bacterium]
MERILQPELLDRLPAANPAARRSRSDLRFLNRLMGNWRWFEREAARPGRRGAHWLELGAGDGRLSRRLARTTAGVRFTGADLQPPPPDWPRCWGWLRGNIFELSSFSGYDAVLANLVLHHFEDDALRRLGARLRDQDGPRLLLFCEPARRRRHLYQLAAYNLLLRPGRVTRHDAPRSVRAGFRRGELPALLGLDPAHWDIREEETFLGACRLRAARR